MLTTCEIRKSPVGPLGMAVRDGALCALIFLDARHPRLDPWLAAEFPGEERAVDPDPAGIRSRLQSYFEGDLAAIDAIPATPRGTPFQESVWRALRDIPRGEAISYAELARRIGRPKAVRAVGAANGANPVSIVVPCHRVIASNKTLCGYGGGLDAKRWLLTHERCLALGPLFASAAPV